MDTSTVERAAWLEARRLFWKASTEWSIESPDPVHRAVAYLRSKDWVVWPVYESDLIQADGGTCGRFRLYTASDILYAAKRWGWQDSVKEGVPPHG